MSSRPDSYMPLFTARWLLSTADLSAQERDAYMLLSIKYWDNGGPLKNDDAKLARMALCSPEMWETIKVTVKAFFEVSLEETVEVLRHHKLDEWIDDAERKYAQAVERSRKANEAKRSKSTSKDTLEVTSKETVKVTQRERERNKSKDLDGSRPRAPSGAAPPPPKTIDPSWNGFQAKLSNILAGGEAEFMAYFANSRLETGPPATLSVPTGAIRDQIVRKHGSKLSRLFGPIEIQVVRQDG